MPELAEVEYFRRQWNPGIGAVVTRVFVRSEKRVFRDVDAAMLAGFFRGNKLLGSEARGKRMLFHFSKGGWLGLHLGMTGSLRSEPAGFEPERHDHLVLYQSRRTLVFRDPRQFGRVQFHIGRRPPEWWASLPPDLDSPAFTNLALRTFLERHRRLPIKASLLLQEGFPGIGNWMADEVLWRAKMDPRRRTGDLAPAKLPLLRQVIRFVCRGAMKHVSLACADPPQSWLFHQRWKPGGICPIHAIRLERKAIAGRTTVWCSRCQK